VLKKMIFVLGVSSVSLLSLGCGGGVASGVAEGQDEPAPVLTPEQKQTEAASARNASGE